MIKLHGKNLKGVTLSVHLTNYGLVIIEDGDSETFLFDNIIDIVYHADKAKTGRLDISLKKPERVIMIVDIKEKKSLDKFLELASRYRENASKKDVDKKVFVVALLSGILIGVFWLFGYMIGFLGIVIGGYIISTVARDYKSEKFYIMVTYAFGVVFSIVLSFICYKIL
jgi:hypothetical protein